MLTHCHPDHMGNAERLRTQTGAPVLIHHDDRAAAMRKGRPPLYPVWKPPVLHLVAHFLRNGVAQTAPVAEASGFADGEVLDVPGRPRVIHTPGHTAGNAALSLADREVLIAGDALATLSLSHGEAGPQLLPRFMNDDNDRALASLDKIEPVSARWVLPAHGLPWEGSPQQAVKLAGRSRPGPVEGPARLTGEMNLLSPVVSPAVVKDTTCAARFALAGLRSCATSHLGEPGDRVQQLRPERYGRPALRFPARESVASVYAR